ncbi:MAG: HAMP domain-containing histidine kinase [Defluviitaleaceae bacterium]|nr:HAMP domain-containing histidine kinase [Defluviitaleaceae bacterium]
MKILGKIYSAIQSHIVTAFSVLLFAAFGMVVLTFGMSMNHYISSGATRSLRVARTALAGEPVPPERVVMRMFRGSHMFEPAFIFEVDENFRPTGSLSQPETAFAVAGALSEIQCVTAFTYSRRLTIHHPYSFWNDIYFVSVIPSDAGARIIYTDVTDMHAFSAVAMRILVIAAVVLWLLSTLVAGVLADSFMKPLRLLRDFVRQIGRGDFTPNTHGFVNEEFDELNRSLNSAALRLAAYDNEQKAFFQNVSHELRTPLTIIKMYAEGIRSGVMNKDAASTILDAENRLAAMVDEILYISRLGSVSVPQMEEINLHIIVSECIRQQRPLSEMRDVEIRYVPIAAPVSANCAMNHIERAINNLISNAIRYAKTVIIVECYTSGDMATIRVSDDGPGFEPNSLPHVFERFYRGTGGLSGIGLSTVKAVAELHLGTAVAENSPKGGAILTLNIPLAGKK